ncbi:MAG: hypothetical protein J5685_07675 [Clostridiales bacterium]|nr:hypothetical protein [Clostridiales bacterium]
MHKKSRIFVKVALVSIILNFVSFVAALVVIIAMPLAGKEIPPFLKSDLFGIITEYVWPSVSTVLSVLALVFSFKARKNGEYKDPGYVIFSVIELFFSVSWFPFLLLTYLADRIYT